MDTRQERAVQMRSRRRRRRRKSADGQPWSGTRTDDESERVISHLGMPEVCLGLGRVTKNPSLEAELQNNLERFMMRHILTRFTLTFD
jgi:hypothetical protein